MGKYKLSFPDDFFSNLDCIIPLDLCIKELTEIFDDKKIALKFLTHLINRLSVLNEKKQDALTYSDWFEHIEDGIHAIRFANNKMTKNVRILYFFDKQDNIVLLHAFKEHKKEHYNPAKKVAKGRIRNYEENRKP